MNRKPRKPRKPRDRKRRRSINSLNSLFSANKKPAATITAEATSAPMTISDSPSKPKPSIQLPLTMRTRCGGATIQVTPSTSADNEFRVRISGSRVLDNSGIHVLTCASTLDSVRSAAGEYLQLPTSEIVMEKKTTHQVPLNVVAALSDEQLDVFKAVVNEGSSIFFTGKAGTGKSYLLRHLVTELKKTRGNDSVFLTASTGVAAANIGGITLHSFAGIGFGEEPAGFLVKKMRKFSRERWLAAKVIVIDEISMIDANLLDKVEEVARVVTGNDAPFGGIQVILCGDFFQLPPVSKSGGPKRFCFRAKCWDQLVAKIMVLSRIYRQKDPQLIRLLNEVRLGRLSSKSESLLEQSIGREISGGDGIKPTRLYSTNSTVDSINNTELKNLGKEIRTFKSDDQVKSARYKNLLNNLPAVETLHLAVGAQVMLLKNLDVKAGLCNGTRGIVLRFERDEENGEWFPLVAFNVPNSDTPMERVIRRESWSIDIGGVKQAEREQIPLRLAWAITIHKSQGMTISKLEIGLANIFEPGMAYVALSRATCLEGLRLLNLEVRRINAHPDVLAFYSKFDREAAEITKPTSPSSSSSSSSLSSSSPKSTPAPLTLEQKERMRKNREAALARKAARDEEKRRIEKENAQPRTEKKEST